MNQPPTQPTPLDHVRRWSPLIALAALGLCALGAWSNPQQFVRSYLVAWLLPLGVSLGSLALIMLHNLTGGAWGWALRRQFITASGLMPLAALLFLPVAVSLEELYPWANAEEVAHDAVLQQKEPYLNPRFFLIRAGGYFVLWTAMALFFNRRGAWAASQALSGLGLVLMALTVTFASIDWGMSLTPHWFSSIYGPLFMVGQALSALAFGGVLLVWLSPEAERIVPVGDTLRDLGNLLLAFTMLWAYMSVSQLVIIWMGNLSEDAVWYADRSSGGWQLWGIFLVVFHFAAPFLVLLSRDVKQHPGLLAGVAGWLLLMRLADLYWMIAPSFHPRQVALHWLDAALPLALGGLWLATLAWRFRRVPAEPWENSTQPVPNG
jgi:hypothetical protein